MFKTRLCLALSGQFSLPYAEQIRLFRKIGFDGFFSGWREGGDIAELGFYHNINGVWDTSLSDELNTTLDAFFEIQKELSKNTAKLPDQKFSSLGK